MLSKENGINYLAQKPNILQRAYQAIKDVIYKLSGKDFAKEVKPYRDMAKLMNKALVASKRMQSAGTTQTDVIANQYSVGNSDSVFGDIVAASDAGMPTLA